MNGAAAVYVAINAMAPLAAFALTRLFGWDFGFNGSPQAREWVQCLVAGFGAMVLLRPSLFTVRAGDREIGFGPARVLQVLLETAEAQSCEPENQRVAPGEEEIASDREALHHLDFP